MSSTCAECDRLWAHYSAAYTQSCDLGKSKDCDPNDQKAADLAWDLARIALTRHVATHSVPRSAETE
jgi:hypothetical protein